VPGESGQLPVPGGSDENSSSSNNNNNDNNNNCDIGEGESSPSFGARQVEDETSSDCEIVEVKVEAEKYSVGGAKKIPCSTGGLIHNSQKSHLVGGRVGSMEETERADEGLGHTGENESSGNCQKEDRNGNEGEYVNENVC
jgi:hypothetical protein